LTRVAAPISEKKVDKIMSSITAPLSGGGSGGSDFSKVIADSQKSLANEPTKRKRRTKAEIEAARGISTADINRVGASAPQTYNSGGFNPQPQPIDRTKELVPAFKLYSEIFLAKPIGCPELSLSDEEAEAIAKVTSNLMNAFPEYFNSNDPKVTAIFGLILVAGPIGYSKYKIFKLFEASKLKQDVKTVI
jgi:hypothetical protein